MKTDNTEHQLSTNGARPHAGSCAGLSKSTDETFWKLMEIEHERLWRLTRGMTSSYDDACDLVSETILAAYRSFPNLREQSAFRKFLTTIATRTYKRKEWRARLFRPLDIDAHDSGTLPGGVYPVERESEFDIELLTTMLQRLPVRQRETLILFEISELSLVEIQRIQGGTISGVKSRLKRGREALKLLMRERTNEIVNDDSQQQLLSRHSRNAGMNASAKLLTN